jgi:hypothetical protein
MDASNNPGRHDKIARDVGKIALGRGSRVPQPIGLPWTCGAPKVFLPLAEPPPSPRRCRGGTS